MRVYYNHPGFVEPQIDLITDALEKLPDQVRATARIVFTTHSIPHSCRATATTRLSTTRPVAW
jgi:protoporphyrin/coproporphyrin ferrochelatase